MSQNQEGRLTVPMPSDLTTVLWSHVWQAGLGDFDHVQAIEFRADGHGLMYWGGGQAMKFESAFAYALTEDGLLRFDFFEVNRLDGPEGTTPERPAAWACSEVAFELLMGPHEPDLGTMAGPVRARFPYLLRFASEPFPPGCGPGYGEPDLDYYGLPLRPEEIA